MAVEVFQTRKACAATAFLGTFEGSVMAFHVFAISIGQCSVRIKCWREA